jgi:hypothetical protein|tara:strand:- start:160 stop:630 length:471 start_codon:yes stop_codon:yes gene_type:complete
MFNTPFSRKYIEKHLNSNYQKINYNKFRWWRWYQDKNSPLPYKSSFRDKILNGDFDPSGYQWQAWLCEHMLNDLLIECDHDYQKYLEKGKLLLARRKRLLEDYEKDENGKLDNLFTHFRKYFKIDRREVEEEALKCCGELIDFYYIIEDKYGKKYA